MTKYILNSMRLIILLFIPVILSCNKSPEIFEGIQLGDSVSNVEKIIDSSGRIERTCFIFHKYKYRNVSFDYRFSFDSIDHKVTRIYGFVCSPHIYNTVKDVIADQSFLYADKRDAAIDVLCKRYGNPRIYTVSYTEKNIYPKKNGPGIFYEKIDTVPTKYYTWDKGNYSIEASYRLKDYNPVLLVKYQLSKEICDKFYFDEHKNDPIKPKMNDKL